VGLAGAQSWRMGITAALGTGENFGKEKSARQKYKDILLAWFNMHTLEIEI